MTTSGRPYEQRSASKAQAKSSQSLFYLVGALGILALATINQSTRVFLTDEIQCRKIVDNDGSADRPTRTTTTKTARPSAPLNSELRSEPPLSLNMTGRTKIVGFSDHTYHTAALIWYKRLSQLGYTTHYIIATDQKFADYLQEKNDENRCDANDPVSLNNPPCFRFDTMIPSGNSAELKLLKFRRIIFANRWAYILKSLREGVNILTTDVDNIFTRYVPMSTFEEDRFRVDALLAHSTGFPVNIKRKYGLTVCGGMSWWRASPSSIRTIEMFKEKCGDSCDDQVAFNTLIHEQLGMEWEWDPTYNNVQARRYSSNVTTFDRESGELRTFKSEFAAVLRDAILGISRVTKLRVRLWSRDFAFRGPAHIPAVCPDPAVNWVAMPISDGNDLGSPVKTKIYLIDVWEHTCGISSARLQPHNYSDGVVVKRIAKK